MMKHHQTAAAAFDSLRSATVVGPSAVASVPHLAFAAFPLTEADGTEVATIKQFINKCKNVI